MKSKWPCPTYDPGRYKIKSRHVDESGCIIGIGEKKNTFQKKDRALPSASTLSKGEVSMNNKLLAYIFINIFVIFYAVSF